MEYTKYQQQMAFDKLSGNDRATLYSELETLRMDAYREALKGEALRLGCNVDKIKAPSPVVPLDPDTKEESMLLALEDEILLKVLQHLDTIDIFRLTLVCKKWKSLVYNYPSELKRAEHAITTHLITFTDWMDVSKSVSRVQFCSSYLSFSWNLTKWYCNISENLESIVLDQAMSHLELVALLQSCPKLKNLVVDNNVHSDYFIKEGLSSPDVQLPNLEVFCSCIWYDDLIAKLNREVLACSKKIKAFRGALTKDDWKLIDIQRPATDVFQNLIALDLTDFSAEVLKLLADVGEFKLKYLRLCRFIDFGHSFEQYSSLAESREYFHQLLPGAKELEVLVVLGLPGVNNTTLELLTQLELNLSFAVLCESSTPRQDYDSTEIDSLKPETIVALQEMLLSKNPDLDLSKLSLIVERNDSWENLKSAVKGMTLHHITGIDHFTEQALTGLNSPAMRRHIGIDF
eukprot:g6055.t1